MKLRLLSSTCTSKNAWVLKLRNFMHMYFEFPFSFKSDQADLMITFNDIQHAEADIFTLF